MNPVDRIARIAWTPQDIRANWEWSEDHIEVDNTSPMPGPWRVASSLWVKEPMEEAQNKSVTMWVVKCAAQAAKTQTVLNLVLHGIAEDPGPSMYVMANAEDAADFIRDRFKPTMLKCKPVKDRLLRESKNGFTFTSMPLYFVGAHSSAKLQGKPMKRLYLDEVRNYPPGAVGTVMKRVRAFGELAQIFMLSTPGNAGDEIDIAFKAGDQRTPHFPCPGCGRIQQLRFAQLKWDKNEHTKPGGIWNFDRLAETIRYECENESCRYQIRDTHPERKMIVRTMRYIRMNPNAPANHVSWTWNALLPWWVKWRGIVEEFIHARAALKDTSNPRRHEKMKTFVTETLAESWEDSLGVVQDFSFLEARKDNYDYGEVMSETCRLFMAADKQEAGGEHYWWVIRAFAGAGRSRLIAHGKASTYQELEELRKQYKVALGDAVIDSGYRAQDVYRFCVANGWRPFKGDGVEYYLVPKPNPAKPGENITVRQIYRKTQAMVYNANTNAKMGSIPLYTFADDPAKDLLFEFMKGLVGQFTIPNNVAVEYMKQVTAEQRDQKTDSAGHIHYFYRRIGPNHYLDCEKMLMIAAIVARVLAAPAMAIVKSKLTTPHK